MRKDVQQLLRKEYNFQTRQYTYCRIGNDKLLLPVAYNGDTDKFIDDLFNSAEEARRYEKHNRRQDKSEHIEPQLMNVGNAYFIAPLELIKKGFSPEEIKKKVVNRALRRYRVAIRKTERVNKAYPCRNVLTKVSQKHISQMTSLYQQHILSKVSQAVKNVVKVTGKQAVNMTTGVVGALPAAAYFFMNKKVHFAKNKTHQLIQEKALPYIRKGAYKALILATLVAGGCKIGKSFSSQTDKKPKIETVFVDHEYLNFDRQPVFEIKDKESFMRLHNQAFGFIFKSMLPTENLVKKPYSDNGKTINTVGLGSYYYPENGNPSTAEKWILFSDYLKKHPEQRNKEISGKKAFNLAYSWGAHRGKGRILKAFYENLQGCRLTVSQYGAIYSCTYNNEAAGKKFSQFVHDNWKDRYACAEFLMNLKPGNRKFEKGIARRHAFEALLYLNVNDFVNRMDYSFIRETGSAVSQISMNDVEKMLKALKTKNDKKIYKVFDEVGKKVLNWFPKYDSKTKTVRDIIYEENLADSVYTESKKDVDFVYEQEYQNNVETYSQAQSAHQEKHYEQELEYLQSLLDKGLKSADIYNDRSIAFFHLGEYDKCIEECQKVLKTGEKDYKDIAYYNLGKAYEKKEDPLEADKYFKLAAETASSEKSEKKDKYKIASTFSALKTGFYIASRA